LLSEHKHRDKAATNSNSENVRSRTQNGGKFAGKCGYGAKKDELSTGRVWAAGFHHITARSRLARVLKLTNRLFF